MAFPASSSEGSKNSSGLHGIPEMQLHDGALAMAPWSPHIFTGSHPFPRRGFAFNSSSGKHVDLLIFGGENSAGINSDLWSIAASGADATPVTTTGNAPSARIGAKATLVGNAFIVFGGSSSNPAKKEDSALYLLNTVTKAWSTAPVQEKKPSARSGHSLNLLGAKVFVFGGQPSSNPGVFSNDLWSFDINSLFAVGSKWELLPASQTAPCARANHSATTHLGKLYIFGGTDGERSLYDVWMFDPITERWSEITTSGYIPAARSSHSAVALAGVLYAFGGISESGEHLGDLVALNLATGYWHQFETIRTVSPPARAHHALCALGTRLFLIGGDISYPLNNDTAVYVIDVKDIRFPSEKKGFSTQQYDRARLTTSNLLAALGPQKWSVEDMDARSIVSNTRSFRSIRSIKTDLGRRISATYSSSEADKILERIFAQAHTELDNSVTASDVRALDVALQDKDPNISRPVGAKNLLSYFRRNRSSTNRTRPEPVPLAKTNNLPYSIRSGNGVDLLKAAGSVRSLHNNYESPDLQRFLALERSMYKELPRSKSVQSSQKPQVSMFEQPTVAQTNPEDLAPALIRGRPSHEHKQDRKKKSGPLLSALTDSFSGRSLFVADCKIADLTAEQSNTTSRVGTSSRVQHDALAEHAERPHLKKDSILADKIADKISQDPSKDPRILLHALCLLRTELTEQKRKLTGQKNAAYVEASRSINKAEREAEDKIAKNQSQSEAELARLRLQFESVSAELDLHQTEQKKTVRDKQALEGEVLQLKSMLRETTSSHQDAQGHLARYVTIEAEAAEMAARQSIQVDMIERLSSQIGAYQLRAASAEKKLEAETYRSHDLEMDILACKMQSNDLELRVKHLQRVSSLSKYTSETSAQEAELSRDILLNNLRKLLGHDEDQTVQTLDISMPSLTKSLADNSALQRKPSAVNSHSIDATETPAHEFVAEMAIAS